MDEASRSTTEANQKSKEERDATMCNTAREQATVDAAATEHAKYTKKAVTNSWCMIFSTSRAK
jgi:hypothetical protein